MAKIVSDSLAVSKVGAPLGANKEVATLADIANIENPTDGLIFYVKETQTHYRVDSLVDVAIPGTTLTRKSIGSYSPMGDVTYTEVGEANLDDVFDQAGMNLTVIGEAPEVDFEGLS